MRLMRLSAIQGVVLVGALLITSSAAADGTTIVYDESEFLQSDIVVTETFDDPIDFPAEQRTVEFEHIRFTSTDTAPPYWVVGGGELYRQFREGPDEHADVVIDVGEGTWVRGLGFELHPFGFPNQFEITVTRAGGTTLSTLLPADTGRMYVGIRDPGGIDSVTISQRPDLADGVLTNFALDDVSRTALLTVPDDKSDCRFGAWQDHLREDGQAFRNQGLCIAYVVTGR